jgi:hypothetical protein
MPSPRNTLAISLAAAVAGTAAGGLIEHNATVNHPEKRAAAPFNVETPAISFEDYLAKSAMHNQVTSPTSANSAHTESAAHTNLPSLEIPTSAPVPSASPETPAPIHAPESSPPAQKPDEAPDRATKDGQDSTNDPSTKPSAFENTSDEESDGSYSDDPSEGGSNGGEDSYSDGSDDGKGQYPDHGGPDGEMTPGANPDTTTAAPGDTQQAPPAPEVNPYLELAQQFSDQIFSNDPGNPRDYITGEMRIYKNKDVSYNIKNAFYHLFQTANGPVLLVGYHSSKGGGNEPKGSLGYEVFDGLNAINAVTIFPDKTGRADIEPALRQSISMTYQSKDNPSAFVGQYGIELGVVDTNQPSSSNLSHLTVRDGHIALEPIDSNGTK